MASHCDNGVYEWASAQADHANELERLRMNAYNRSLWEYGTQFPMARGVAIPEPSPDPVNALLSTDME